MQKKWINETKEGLPDSKPDVNRVLISPWQDRNRLALEHHIESFEDSIDSLIEYVKKNKINKHWWDFFW
jgi:hypothetical protein